MEMTSAPLPDRPSVGSAYRDLPRPDGSAPAKPEAFRLWEVRHVRESLEEDARRHSVTRRRYKRAVNALINTDVATTHTIRTQLLQLVAEPQSPASPLV